MASPLPGHVGMPIVGDKSVEFYRDAIGFVNSRIAKHGSRIFATRFLNKPTVFVASNKGVQELLNDEGGCYEMGYKQFMEAVYGDNVVFSDGEEAQELRTILQQLLLSNDSYQQFQNTVEQLTHSTLDKLDTTKAIPVYKLFKKLTTEICLSMFLDLDFSTSSDLAEKVVSLTTKHWHGIVSLPINLKLPMMNSRSAFGNALQAKEALLEIIEHKLGQVESNGFPRKVTSSSLKHARNHVLLFTSALVPKALASMLTAFVVHTANRKSILEEARNKPEKLEHILLELQRLYPPFAGGRRVAKKDSTLCGLHVPAGHAIVYMTQHAQRDPLVFPEPDSFVPARWEHEADKQHLQHHDKDNLFLFGGGPRCCIGQHLVWHVLKTVSQTLLDQYQWDITPGQSLVYKWLPVSRPKEDLTVMFTTRSVKTTTPTAETTTSATTTMTASTNSQENDKHQSNNGEQEEGTMEATASN